MSTRQATPGPSNVSALNTISINSRKRGVSQSEGLSDSVRKPKKSKGDDPKDKKKRRRKKRKISVTTPSMLSLSSSRSRSKSRTMTAEPPTPINDSTESHSTLSLAAILDQEEKKVQLLEDDEVSEASSSKVDKGKGKAKEALDNNSPHEIEIERLKKEIEAQKLLLQRHQSHLNQIQQSLSCEICLDLMHRPFALAPCGHVACHTCLVAWFTRDDERTAGFPQPQNHFNRKKTCPVCRALVIQRPAEVWGLKSMVSNFQRSGLIESSTLPSALPTAGSDNAKPSANNSGENNDPWQNIFRSARSERNPYHPLSPINHQGGIEDVGIYDEEDGGVYRCIDCINEIVGNRCTACLRIYPGHLPEDEDDDDFDDEDEDLDPDDMHEDHPILQNLLNALANGEPIEDDYGDYESEADQEILEYFGAGHHSGSEDAEDEEDEVEVDGHGGFGFDLGVGGMGYPLTGGPVHQLGPQWLDEESEDEDEPSAYIEEVHGREDEEDEEGHFEPSFINDEEEEEEDDSDGSSIYASPVNTSYRRRPETVVLSDDEDDEEEDDEVQFVGSARRGGSRYQRTMNTGGAVIISSDEED